MDLYSNQYTIPIYTPIIVPIFTLSTSKITVDAHRSAVITLVIRKLLWKEGQLGIPFLKMLILETNGSLPYGRFGERA